MTAHLLFPLRMPRRRFPLQLLSCILFTLRFQQIIANLNTEKLAAIAAAAAAADDEEEGGAAGGAG